MTPLLEDAPVSRGARFESVAPRESKSRLAAWDAARLIATWGIVWTHVAEAHGQPASWGILGRFGTSFYILAAALFTVRSAMFSPKRHFSVELAKKSKRLLLPFVVWSAIYFAYYGWGALQRGQTWKSLTFWWGPLAGTAIHLWFLPFIFVWGMVGTFVVPQLFRLHRRLLFVLAPAISLFLYWISYTWVWFAVDRYWLWDYHLHRLDRWIVEVPLYVSAVLLGSAFYQLTPWAYRQITRRAASIALGCLGVFLVAQFLYCAHLELIHEATRSEGRFLANVAGLCLLCGSALMSHTRFVQKLAPFGKYTYVAFLCHMLVLELLRGPMHRLPGYGTLPTALLGTFLVFGCSLGLSMLIVHQRWLKWLRP